MSTVNFIHNDRKMSELLRDYIRDNTEFIGREMDKEHWIAYSTNNKCIESVLIVSYIMKTEKTWLFSVDFHTDNSDVGKKLFHCLLEKINTETSETARLARNLAEFVGDIYNGDKLGHFDSFNVSKRYVADLYLNSSDCSDDD